MSSIISVIEIQLTEPLCEHRPRMETSPWSWEIIPTMVNSVPSYGLRISCSMCGAEDSIPLCKFVAAFSIGGKPAEGAQAAVRATEFTTEDKRFLRKLKIKVE